MTDKSYLTYLYLYAAYDKPKVVKLVKNRCIPMEFDLLDQTVASWEKATNTLRRIEKQESGIADNAELFDISSGLIEGIKLNPAITNTFSKDNIDFKMVEIDKLIAVQRQVLLDFVDELTKKIPRKPSEDDLLKFCLIPEHIAPQPKISRRGSDSMYFASPSGDFRFLGGYLKKEITEEDIKTTRVSGYPTHAIMLFVGYGASPMQAYSVNGRLILANGFHRAYALRKKGIKKIPLLIRIIGNADLEFPDEIQDLDKNYLLHDPRPIMVKDFFNEDLVREFKRPKTTTLLRVKWDDTDVRLQL